MKIVHVGLFHRSDDIRIYVKECASLVKAGYDVTYITTKTETPAISEETGVKVVELNLSKTGPSRFFHPFRAMVYNSQVKNSFISAISVEKPDIIHVHELILLKLVLRYGKKNGVKVIYDIHEDVPRQFFDAFQNSSFVIRFFRKIQASLKENRENELAHNCDALITATPAIQERFESMNDYCVCVPNYPVLDNVFSLSEVRTGNACYIGAISVQRGIIQVVDAFAGTKMKLELVGSIAEPLLKELESREGWKNVIWHGYLSRMEADAIRNSSSVGIVTFLPAGNQTRSLPNKIFEYMASGLPLIASNFPEWKSIIEDSRCGICVDPASPEQICKALDALLADPITAHTMGIAGYRAVQEKYNWNISCNNLLRTYKELQL